MWKIYAVKTLFRTETSGEAISEGNGFSENFDLVEERIVTVKARSFDEAIERAERDAKEYAADPFINPFGQEVRWRYTGSSGAYEPYDTMPANIEVYSDTYLIPRSLPNDQLADNVFGKCFKDEEALRLNFLNSEMAGFR